MIFMVAETLGRMAWEIEEEMPPDELDEWVAFLTKTKPEAERRAMERAKREAGRKRRKR